MLNFIITGTDGTGKSTLVNHINDLNIGIVAIDRDAFLDKQTLEHTFNERPPLPVQNNTYYFILTAKHETIMTRLRNRDFNDKWESEKAIFYYSQRYRELAAYYGIPVISTDDITVADTVDLMRNLIPSYYEVYRSYALCDLQTFDDKFFLYTQGESKKVYKSIFLPNICFIQLKPTIYSHSMQSTAEIDGLSRVRAKGTQIFLEMMWRNGLNHAYHSVNQYGIIVSDFIKSIPPTEIVFKAYCTGTDKHSYYNYTPGKLKHGPYIRFDWRNPNHVLNGVDVRDDTYYQRELEMGKERFFKEFLSKATPMGDKTISEDLLYGIIDTDMTRKNAIKLYLTIKGYLSKVNLEVQDGCFMLNEEGTVFWSEINQDCMRIKKDDKSLDKDIWRAGGSSAKEEILCKWNIFNDIMIEYFNSNKFHETEINEIHHYIYQDAIELWDCSPRYQKIYDELKRKRNRKDVIVTIDLYDKQPVLVKSGNVREAHSFGHIKFAMDRISLLPNIMIVDLNGAIDDNPVNRDLIKKIAINHYIYTGGGIRSIKDVQELLSSSVRRVVIGTNLELIDHIPKDRLIVELTVNENNKIMTNGRKVTTDDDIIDKIKELCDKGVTVFSITFHNTEGHLKGLPRKQISDIMMKIPNFVDKIIIAGGITSCEDLEFLWNYDKIVPQIGSAIWKDYISISDIYNTMIGDNIIPAIIQDTHGKVRGLVYMNNEAIDLTCATGLLCRYSRRLGRIIKKGETSGSRFIVKQMSVDCDSDALLITVYDSLKCSFCHLGKDSCFNLQTTIKGNFLDLQDYIYSRMTGNTYTSVMQHNPNLALNKVMEEFWEVVTAVSDKERLMESCDLLIHLIMYWNGNKIKIEDIMNVLNSRKFDPKLIPKQIKSPDDYIRIGITGTKYCNKTDNFIETKLGMKLKRESGRSLKIEYEIINQSLYDHYFTKKVVFVPMRPKDMCWALSAGRIDSIVTYNTVIDNFPCVCKSVINMVDNDLTLALIKRKNEEINFDSKVLIAAEHINNVHRYLIKSGLKPEQFSLDRIIGSSESYMVNCSDYKLCDAIIETGATMVANDLEVYKVILNKGEIKICYYVPNF